jgi:hypothetical protein
MADWQAARRMVAEWIRIHWPLIAPDMHARGLNMEQLLHQVEYFESHAPPQHYGDEATLYIAAWILHQRVIVINTLTDTATVVLPDAPPLSPGTQEIVVVYNGTNHYDGTVTARMPRAQHGDATDQAQARDRPDRGAQEGRPRRRARGHSDSPEPDAGGPTRRKGQRNRFAEESPKRGPRHHGTQEARPDQRPERPSPAPGSAVETQAGRPCRRSKRHGASTDIDPGGQSPAPATANDQRQPRAKRTKHTQAHTTGHEQARWDPRGGSLGGGLQEGDRGDSGPLREARKKRGIG